MTSTRRSSGGLSMLNSIKPTRTSEPDGSTAPFSTHKEFFASLHKEAEKLSSKENKTLGVMRLLRMSLRQAVVALGPESTTPLAHTQKYDEKKNRWRAPVTRDWSFYFIIEDDISILQDVMRHPK